MGLNGLRKLAKEHAPKAITQVTYSQFAGQSVSVDASIFFYKFCHDAKSKKSNPHVDGFYQLIYRLYKHGIQPVIVFDGKKPLQKLHTVNKRIELKQKNIDQAEHLQDELISMLGGTINCLQGGKSPALNFKQLIDHYIGQPTEVELRAKLAELEAVSKNIITFQPTCYQDVMYLCDMMKVPYYQANWEADALCTKLYLDGQVQAILSEDTDILLYKGGKLMCKVGWGFDLECIDLDILLSELGLSYNQFVEWAVLSGTDYTVETISGIGPVRAYEYIKQGHSISDILRLIHEAKELSEPNGFEKYNLPSDFDYQSAIKLIYEAHENEPNVILPPKGQIDQIDAVQLSQYMIEKCRCMAKTIPKHYEQMLQTKHLFTPKPKIKVSVTLKNKILINPVTEVAKIKPKVTLKAKPT